MSADSKFRVPKLILVSPKGSANVGGIARLMGNFGLSEMRVVNPRCELFSKEARMMGLKNHEILQAAKTYDSLCAAQEDLHWTVALSVRSGAPSSPFISLKELFSNPTNSPPVDQDWAFVFGREDNGLEAEELRRCNLEVFIPTHEARPSMNLTSAAAITLFQYFSRLQANEETVRTESLPKKEDEEIFFRAAAELFKEIGFIKTGEMERMLFELRDIYRRAQVGRRDLRIFFGILADLERALGKKFISKKTADLENESFLGS